MMSYDRVRPFVITRINRVMTNLGFGPECDFSLQADCPNSSSHQIQSAPRFKPFDLLQIKAVG